MSSGKSTTGTSEAGGKSYPSTPSITLLNRMIGTSPAPRMLTPYEIHLLRQCAKETVAVAREVFARKEGTSGTEPPD